VYVCTCVCVCVRTRQCTCGHVLLKHPASAGPGETVKDACKVAQQGAQGRRAAAETRRAARVGQGKGSKGCSIALRAKRGTLTISRTVSVPSSVSNCST